MAKLTFTEIDNINASGAASTINANFTAVAAAIEKQLSRDGTTPNVMSADLDMNGFTILNAEGIEGSGDGGGSSFTISEYVVYHSDVGENTNNGLTIDAPKATIAAALSAASTLATATGERAVVISDSAQTLTGNLTFPEKVSLIAPALRLVGNHLINDECLVDIYEAITTNSTDNIFQKVGTGNSYVRMRQMDLRGTAGDKTSVIGLFCNTGGVIWADIDRAVVSESSTLMRDGTTDSAYGQIFYHGREIILAANNAEGIRTRANSTLFVVNVDRIRKSGTPTGTIAVGTNSANTPTVRLTAQQIQADTAWENLGTSSLFVNCPSITGTQGSGGATVNGKAYVSISLADGDATIQPNSVVVVSGTAAADVTLTLATGSPGDTIEIIVSATFGVYALDFQTVVTGGDPTPEELVATVANGRTYHYIYQSTKWVASSVNYRAGVPGALGLKDTITLAAEIGASGTASEGYIPSVSGAGLAWVENTGDSNPAPSIVTSDASPFAMSAGADTNVIYQSHQASVDFEVPVAATAGRVYLIEPLHSGCTVSNVSGAGSVSGTTNLVNGRIHAARVQSNPGSAPVTVVTGGVTPGSTVSSTKTYDADDHESSFYLDGSSGDQTMPAAASVPQGWVVFIKNRSGGNRNIVGADSTFVLADDGTIAVEKDEGGALVVSGTGASTLDEIDAA